MKNRKCAKMSEATSWHMIVLAKLGTMIQDNLDAEILPSDDEVKNLYEVAKKFVEAYEAQEGDDKS